MHDGSEHVESARADQAHGERCDQRTRHRAGGEQKQQASRHLDESSLGHVVVGMRDRHGIDGKREEAEQAAGDQDLGRGDEQTRRQGGARGGREDAGQRDDDAPIEAIRSASDRPLADGARDHRRAHEDGHAGDVEARLLRERWAKRPERAVCETDGDAAHEPLR
jgi:hypothetical protein